MEHEKCYIFKADDHRPKKRRRIEKKGLDASLELRKNAFDSAWAAQEQHLQRVITEKNKKTIHDVHDFAISESETTKLQVGLVELGTTNADIFVPLSEAFKADGNIVTVTLSASAAPNLKTLLKTLISRATEELDDSDVEDEPVYKPGKAPKLLNYDLEKLHQWSKGRNIWKIVVILQDSEAFDAGVLTSFLLLLKYVQAVHHNQGILC